MDESRMQDYLTLIEKLSASSNPQGARQLLQELLQTELERLQTQGSQQMIFAVLRRHLAHLNLGFIPVMQQVIRGLIAENPQAAETIVALMENISIHISNFPLGNRADNLEITLAGYGLVLEVRTQAQNPEGWAQTQNNLANAYSERIRGDRGENLEQAIAAYALALEVRTRQDFPVQWATTQNNLAIAYRERIRGDQAENLEQAIAAYALALEVRTRQDFPVDWAMTQNNLAIAYRERIRGDRAENLEQAIA
ncbi:MAG: tetratricopeptide repeat protein, partial [Synechococcales bacterium]|nr:tetratricopeptide repeat protein [Synechococcales bacterium]